MALSDLDVDVRAGSWGSENDSCLRADDRVPARERRARRQRPQARLCVFECGALSFERDRRCAVEPRADVVEALPLALERSPRGSLQ